MLSPVFSAGRVVVVVTVSVVELVVVEVLVLLCVVSALVLVSPPIMGIDVGTSEAVEALLHEDKHRHSNTRYTNKILFIF